MKNLIFILIPLLFLSSCTIDWNDEKDKQNSQPTQIQKIETGAIIIENSKPQTTIGALNKDFGSGFTLSQTDNETQLSYSGKVIKTWSHTPPEKVPFVWDEACIDFFEAMEGISPTEREKNPNWKQAVWNKFDTNTKKLCIKEYLGRNIEVLKSTMRFFEIRKIQYERWDTWIYDIKTGNIQSIPIEGQNIKITQTNSGITLIIINNYDGPDLRMNYSSDFSQLISKKEVPK